MKIHVEYDRNDLFNLIKESKIFDIMDNFFIDNFTLYDSYIDNNYLVEYINSIYKKLIELGCDIEEPIINDDKNHAFEFWNTKYNKNKKVHTSKLTWHMDDYDAPVNYQVYTAILYYHRGDGITNGNLLIDTLQEEIKIDCWSRPTLVIFKGDTYHKPEDVTVTDQEKELKRQVVVVFFKCKNKKFIN